MVKKYMETHSKDIFKIPDYYKVMIDNIITDESPRYHTTDIIICFYKHYSVRFNYLNKGDGYFSYELIVDYSNPKFYELDDPSIKPLPPMYNSTWDFDGTLHVFQKDRKSVV